MNKIFGLMKEADDDTKWAFACDVHTAILELYFGKYWSGDTTKFEHSGVEPLANKINDLKPQRVLDIGCGYNYFKDKLNVPFFEGIDPYNDNADIKTDLWTYEKSNPEPFDVIIALGSINFGPYDKILHEFEMVDRLTKSGGTQFWRVNPGITHQHDQFPLIGMVDFFPWNKQIVENLAKVYGYDIKDYQVERNHNGDERIYFELYKY